MNLFDIIINTIKTNIYVFEICSFLLIILKSYMNKIDEIIGIIFYIFIHFFDSYNIINLLIIE